MYKNEARTFIIKICMSNNMLVFALSCHMTYIFKKGPSKNFNTNPSNSGPGTKHSIGNFGVVTLLKNVEWEGGGAVDGT